MNDNELFVNEMIRIKKEFLSSLNNSNDLIIADLKNAFNTAAAVGEQGVANFIADRITAHEKWRWKITSSLKTMGSN